MSKKSDAKIKEAVDLLRYSLSLDDEELLKSTIESVILLLEEGLKK
jgi:hypothetical protein